MIAADIAHNAALHEITRVKNAGETHLNFDEQVFQALTHLPPEMGELKTLRRVDLSNTHIENLTPLAGLKQLSILNLTNTLVTDIAVVSQLENLNRLWLNDLALNDLTDCANLLELQALSFSNTHITDLRPLEALPNLTTLFLAETGVTDLTPIAGLKDLRWLYLNNSAVEDLSPIAHLDFDITNDEPYFFKGLYFEGCAAAQNSAELERLSKIEDDWDRTQLTLAYLRRIP